MSLISKFDILKELDYNFVNSIIYLYIPFEHEVFFVTDTDEVYYYLSFGRKTLKCLKELNGRHVSNFFSSYGSFVALTNNGLVYCWGDNSYGQLGNGTTNECESPKLNVLLSDHFVIDICCGFYHTLALTSEGNILSFGRNTFGQIGNDSTEHQLTPYLLSSINSKVIGISCGFDHSVALTESGNIYVWGDNNHRQIGLVDKDMQKIPVKLDMPMIKKVICGRFNVMMLTMEGDLFFCGYISSVLTLLESKKLNTSRKFMDIAASPYFYVNIAQSENHKYYIINNNSTNLLQELVNVTSIEEAFINCVGLKITYKTMLIFENSLNNSENEFTENLRTNVREKGVITEFEKVKSNETKNKRFSDLNVLEEIKMTEDRPLVPENKDKVKKEIFFQNGRFKNEFICNFENSENIIDSHSFSEVYKARQKYDDQYYAIKIIKFLYSDDDDYAVKLLREVKVNAAIKFDYLLQYKSFWFESDKRFTTLYVQMELCKMDLREVIRMTGNVVPNFLHLFTITQIFLEILSGVNYLHTHQPPIIHRNLKPANILVTSGENGRFIKIADFGFAVFHENDEHSRELVTYDYTAPEVKTGRYDTMTDIYSLGMLLARLTNYLSKRPRDNNYDQFYQSKLHFISMLKSRMIDHMPQNRPTCKSIIEDKSWLLSEGEIVNVYNFKSLTDNTRNVDELDNNFFEYFTYEKIKSSNIKQVKHQPSIFSRYFGYFSGMFSRLLSNRFIARFFSRFIGRLTNN